MVVMDQAALLVHTVIMRSMLDIAIVTHIITDQESTAVKKQNRLNQ